ncbi:MAG: hypothetical protein Q7S84_03945 [bacterium]|nr:hypothetical protein [bacterium]
MVLLLQGPDSYRRNRKLRELVATFQAKHAHADLMDVDFEEEPDAWVRACEFILQPSLFSSAKMLVVRAATAINEKVWRVVLKEHRDDKHFFLLVSEQGKLPKPFAFLAEPPAKVQEFLELAGKFLDTFVLKEAKPRAVAFAPDAKRFFLEYLTAHPDRSCRAVNELERISLAGLPIPVSLPDLQKLIPWGATDEVFRVARMLAGAGSAGSKLALLEQLFAAGAEPGKIFNSLAYQVRGDAVVRLADYDVSVKSGGLEYEEALLDFILADAV